MRPFRFINSTRALHPHPLTPKDHDRIALGDELPNPEIQHFQMLADSSEKLGDPVTTVPTPAEWNSLRTRGCPINSACKKIQNGGKVTLTEGLVDLPYYPQIL